MPVAQLSEAALYYDDQGGGEPLVLIPGFASGAWSWDWQIRDLSEDFRVITFDPRGVARSRVDDGTPVSIDLIADDVADLLEFLGIVSANVLGISFGGFVAQAFALKYPVRLKKLILASTSFGGPNHIAPSMEVLTAFASTEGLNTSERIRKYLTTAFLPDFATAEHETVERFCKLREDNAVPEDIYRQQLASAFAFNTEQRIKRIAAETLVITGRLDAVVPMQNSENIAERMPNAHLEIIENAGHMAFVEQADEFNSRVRRFLQG
jgi:pimeloyl-ACP methyl ester carboxylesterase